MCLTKSSTQSQSCILSFLQQENVTMKILDPQGSFLQKWNKILLITFWVAISVDPLFFYIPVIKDSEKCLDLDGTLQITVCVLRTFLDLFGILRIIFQFRTGYIAASSRVFGRGELIDDPVAIIKRYLNSYFIIDILSILPIPQVLLLATIPNQKISDPFVVKELLKYIVLIQYVPRLVRIRPLYKEITRTSSIVTATLWAAALYNLHLIMIASHVVGANWYLFSIESEVRCWRQQMKNAEIFHESYLHCGHHNQTVIQLLNRTCSLIDPDQITDPRIFSFGIFFDALRSGVVESTTDFPKKIFYCFWWGLRNLGSIGQNLKTSTHVGEIVFCLFIAIVGLALFTLIIGTIQKYQQTVSVRVEEMRVKMRDAERWMSHRMLPTSLRRRIRQYEQCKWQATRGVEEETLICNFPKDLQRDIKRHLCLALVKKVPIFEEFDEMFMDAICERLKPVLYTEKSYIVREGDPVEEMLFIIRGNLTSTTTNGGRSGFFNYSFLKGGDFCGEELLITAFNSSSNLLMSTRTILTESEVEAFSLTADDLKLVTSQIKPLPEEKLKHTFRFYSVHCRTRAACFIQAAWRRYQRRKILKSLREAEEKLQVVCANEDEKSLSLTAAIYASRFAANALQNLRESKGNCRTKYHKL